MSVHGVADAHDDSGKTNDLYNNGANGFADAVANEIADRTSDNDRRGIDESS